MMIPPRSHHSLESKVSMRFLKSARVFSMPSSRVSSLTNRSRISTTGSSSFCRLAKKSFPSKLAGVLSLMLLLGRSR